MYHTSNSKKSCPSSSPRIKILTVGLAAMLSVCCSATLAQTSPQVTAQLRFRSEFRQNADFDSRLGDQQIFVAQRIRLGANWQPRPDMTAFVQFQDARLWGEEPSTTSALANIDLHQAFIELREFGMKSLTLRIGRQEFDFGKGRLVGSFDWDQNARAFDALLLTHRSTLHRGKIWFARVQEKNATGADHNQEFAGASYRYGGDHRASLAAYVMLLTDDREFPIGSSSGEALFMPTVGVHVTAKVSDQLEVEAEGAYQFGKHGSLDIQAFTLSLRGVLLLPHRWSPAIAAGYDFGSGDENPNDGKLQTFSALFPSTHRHLGAMDYASRSNIAVTYFESRLAPAKSLGLAVSYHYLQLAHGNDAWYAAAGFNFDRRLESFLPALPGESIELGHEVDFTLSYEIRESVQLRFGLSRFFAGGFLKAGNAGADHSDWGYLSIQTDL